MLSLTSTLLCLLCPLLLLLLQWDLLAGISVGFMVVPQVGQDFCCCRRWGLRFSRMTTARLTLCLQYL